jgi:hypothetical protein
MCHNHHIRIEVLIIVSFVEAFSSKGGATIVPAMVTAPTHPSRIERARDQAVAWVHVGFLP